MLRSLLARPLGRLASATACSFVRKSVPFCSSQAGQMAFAGGSLVAAAAAAAASLDGAAAAEAAPSSSSMPPKVLCLHGVNLNMFGKRDSATYGTATLADINDQLSILAFELGLDIECFQTNHEGEMVERIHRAHTSGEFGAVLINAGAWTHYSYGLRDALAILSIPVIEVHMSNIHAREDMAGSSGEQMRHHSVVSPLAKGIVAGFGLESYLLGLRASAQLLAHALTSTNGPAKSVVPRKSSKEQSPFGGLDK